MPNDISSLASGLFSFLLAQETVLALWLGLSAHYFFPIPRSLSPITYWCQFALILSDKVNRDEDSRRQKLTSGSLAYLVMIVTVTVLLIALKQLVWYSWLFHAVLLWLALDWQLLSRWSVKLCEAMAANDKTQARELLANRLNRETHALSLIGIGKAGAETILLGAGRNAIAVLFWYALLGGVGALIYTLTMSLARAWSPSRQQFVPFGVPANRILSVLDLVPLRLLALLIAIGRRASGVLRSVLAQGELWRTPGPGWLLTSASAKYQLSLGGPAIYDETKRIRSKIGHGVVPAAIHLAQLRHKMARMIIVWALVQTAIMLAFSL